MRCLSLIRNTCQGSLTKNSIEKINKGEIRMDLELTIINIINFSGEARSFCMEAIGYAKAENLKRQEMLWKKLIINYHQKPIKVKLY